MKKLLPVIPALLLASTAVQATNIFIEGGIHFGGDDLAGLTFIGGGSETVEAGGLISGAFGFITDINDDMELRASIGIKFDSVTAENAEITFTRLPLTAMLFNKGEKFSFGAGATYHLGPELDISGSLGGGTVDFDDAFGLVAEVDYKLGDRGYLGMKFTMIDYDAANCSGCSSVDGNSIGFVIGARF